MFIYIFSFFYRIHNYCKILDLFSNISVHRVEKFYIKWIVFENSMYIDKLRHSEITDASFVIANSFTLNEPLTRYLKLNSNSFQEWCHKIIDASIGDNMCFVAKINDEIVGCIIAKSLNNSIIPEFPDAKPIIEFFNGMENYYPVELKSSKSLHIHLAATKHGHERKNICFKLLSCLLRAAKDQDYEYAIAELTSSGTQHICLDKLNFQSLYNLDYKTDSRFPNLEGKCVLGLKKL